VKIKINEIKKLTPQLLEAAEMASRQSVGSAASEHLHLVSQEWASKVSRNPSSGRKKKFRGRFSSGYIVALFI